MNCCDDKGTCCPEGPPGPVGPPGSDPAGGVIDGQAKWLDSSGRWCEICGTQEHSPFYRCDKHLNSMDGDS